MKSSKKILVTVAITISIMAIAAIAFFIFVPVKKISSENQTLSAAPQLKSFRGVLAGTLLDAKEEVVKIGEKIGEAVSNPFASTANNSLETSSENIFTFAILGDTQYFDAGNPQGNFQKAVAIISNLDPDKAVAVGDLIGNCKGKNSDAVDYSNWKKILGQLADKTYAVQGNHDRVSDGKSCDQIWQNAFIFPTNGPAGFSETVYSLDFQNSHFVMLDSDNPDGHQINEAQRAWLEQDLSKNKQENTFVFFHEPAYPVSSKIGESLDADPSERNSLWQILEKHNVTAVFNGHEHIVSRRKIGKVYQFVFGNTDSFNHDLPKTGVAEYASQIQGSFGLVKVNGKEITVETHGPDGLILDSFVFSK